MRPGDLDHLLLKLDAELFDDARYIDIRDQISNIIENEPPINKMTSLVTLSDGYGHVREAYYDKGRQLVFTECISVKELDSRYININERKELSDEGEWIPVSERLPEERINPNTKDFEYVLCSTIWGDVRAYKFGKLIGENKAHFWLCGGIMDKYITAWQPLPEPYKEEGAEE